MTREQFFDIHRPRLPVFVLTREVKTVSYYWTPGSSPHEDPRKLTLPEGTQITKNGYSAFEDGYSMSIRGRSNRWFRVPYDAFEPLLDKNGEIKYTII